MKLFNQWTLLNVCLHNYHSMCFRMMIHIPICIVLLLSRQLNEKGNITNSIKKFIRDTIDQFDINKVNVFRKELPNLYTVLKRVPHGTGEKSFNPSHRMFCDYRDYLSYNKYSCVNHFSEFCGSNHKYL